MTDQPPAVVSPPEIPVPQTLVCANCGTPLAGEYCTRCGQRDEPHVHSVTHFASEALESITHADSRLWRTLWFLLAKPGKLTLEFFAGHRVGYLPPFRLYLVISLLFFLVARMPEGGAIQIDDEPAPQKVAQMKEAAGLLEGNLSGTPGAAEAAAAIRAEAAKEEEAAKNPASAADGDETPERKGLQENNAFTEFCKEFAKPDPKAGKNYDRMRAACMRFGEDHGEALFQAVVHNIPRAMFVFLPLLALFMKVLYWRPKRYYVEHLLLLIHNHAFVFLALTILYSIKHIPVVGEHVGLLEAFIWLYIVWYIFRGMRIYYGQSRKLTFAKYVAVGLAYISTSVTVLLLTAIFSALTM